MLSALVAPVINALTGNLIGGLEDAYKAYLNKEITRDELHARVKQALINAFAEVEKAYAASIAETFGAYMKAAQKSKTMQAAYAWVVFSESFVLLWHQLGIPAVTFYMGKNFHYPSSGNTSFWAFSLVALCLGGGAYAMRSAPGASAIADHLRSLGRG